MRRSATVFLSLLAICLLGMFPAVAQKWPEGPFSNLDFMYATLEEYEEATGKKIEKFNEAPELRVKVAAGELPPVEERLPDEPMVIEPVEEIGRYGGTYTTEGVTGMEYSYHPTITQQDVAFTKVMPYLIKRYEFSEDYKTLTLYFRKGMKWSDGYPFTANDMLFTWEDVILNKELTPAISKKWMPGGKLAEFEKIDDYTLRIHFAVPAPGKAWEFNRQWQIGAQWTSFNPKHYLKKWHIKYNPEADKLAKEEGYEYWWEAFNYHLYGCLRWTDETNCPTLGPWVKKEVTTTYSTFERNPYFFQVDTAGNQLPYIGKVMVPVVGSEETKKLNIIAGEYDYVVGELADLSFYKQNEEKGGYLLIPMRDATSARVNFGFNCNHKDPVLRRIFQDVRWRQAMSLAIDREEVNEICYFGMGIPTQGTVDRSCSYYKKEWGEDHPYSRYDPEEANRLLDEIGLDKRDAEGWRLRPDGKRLSLNLLIGYITYVPKELELVKEYWEAVGVKIYLKGVELSYYRTVAAAANHDVGIFGNSGAEGLNFTYPLQNFVFYSELDVAPMWDLWITSGGKEGEEPPEDVKRFYGWIDEWLTTAPGSKKYMELAEKMFDWYADKIWMIGIVGNSPFPVMVSKKLGNTAPMKDLPLWGWYTDFNVTFLPEQWFFKE